MVFIAGIIERSHFIIMIMCAVIKSLDDFSACIIQQVFPRNLKSMVFGLKKLYRIGDGINFLFTNNTDYFFSGFLQVTFIIIISDNIGIPVLRIKTRKPLLRFIKITVYHQHPSPYHPKKYEWTV